MIYLDHAATTYVYPDLVSIISEDLREKWGNPSAAYKFGVDSKQLIEDCRRKIARIIGATPDEIFFTSGSSEGNAWAINQAMKTLCSPYEHHNITANHKSIIVDDAYIDSMLETKNRLGFTPGSFLLSWMYVNNETGEIFNPNKYGSYARELEILYHCDMTQAAGNIDINLKELPVDIATFSGHKFHAPKGVGFVYFNKETLPVEKIKPLIYGGGQESSRRAGTENVPYIHAMALALDRAQAEVSMKNQHCKKLKIRFIEELYKNFDNDDFYIVTPANSVNSILNVAFRNVESEILSSLLADEAIYVNTGSACNDGSMEVSQVLQAMKVPEEYIHGPIRISMDLINTEEEIITVVNRLKYYHNQLIIK